MDIPILFEKIYYYLKKFNSITVFDKMIQIIDSNIPGQNSLDYKFLAKKKIDLILAEQ